MKCLWGKAFLGENLKSQETPIIIWAQILVWKQISVTYVSEKVKCEVCGHVFQKGETTWARFTIGRVMRARPMGNPTMINREDRTVYRCQKCYELMWH